MTPLQVYYQKILEKSLQKDPQQERVMQLFQQIYDNLLRPRKWFSSKSHQGLYLWGEVGRGKTLLMDLFYESLTVPKLRFHFHLFMQYIHTQLTELQGHINPLKELAKQLASKVNIICLDEFLVHEIGDAMLLSQLLHALFQQGIVLVTTANTDPSLLYKNSFQYEQFLPMIALIKKNLTVFHLSSPIDYRRVNLAKTTADSPFIRLAKSPQALFDKLTEGKTVCFQPLFIQGRFVPHLGYTDDLIWFDFASICAIPRSTSDYLILAKRFSSILISDVKPIHKNEDNLARLFMSLVDILHDSKNQLILTGNQPIIDIYAEGRFIKEFERTKSRLISFKKKIILKKQ